MARRRDHSPQKVAIILLNLGGPDRLRSVKPFLFNLFSDPAIIPLPWGIRHFLAKIIALARNRKAQKIYAHLGGKSPLLENTQKQAEALQNQFTEDYPDDHFRVFIAMRYWHPFTKKTIRTVNQFNPDKIILLPLYPQFSETTSGSSFKAWEKQGGPPHRRICCYFDHPGFVNANVDLICQELAKVPLNQKIRLLFSAHGLPERNIAQGDPYQWQVEQTVSAIMTQFAQKLGHKESPLDHAICYQSKVGKLTWIGPSLDDEIKRAATDQVGVIIVPISFVSEHSETLVELDIDYVQQSHSLGIPYYGRVPTVMDHKEFIKELTNLVAKELDSGALWVRRCPDSFSQCQCQISK